VSGPSRSQAAGSLAIATPTGLGHAENRLIQYKQGSTVLASYTYDGDGTLVQKVAGGATTTYAGTHYEKTVWSALSATPLNRGVACSDGATGTGYLMYSEESVHTRFEAHPPHLYNADHFICVKYANGWVYDSDSAYYAFTPELSDRLVAAVDYSSDTVTALVGVDGDDHGIVKGYASGDLSFTANQWGGVANPGEFGVSGTQFTPNEEEDGRPTT
jgi:YD repeat-containing protein